MQDSTTISAARHEDTGLGGGGRKEVEREHFPLDLGWLDDLFNGKHGRAGYTSRSGTVFSGKKHMLRRRFFHSKTDRYESWGASVAHLLL